MYRVEWSDHPQMTMRHTAVMSPMMSGKRDVNVHNYANMPMWFMGACGPVQIAGSQVTMSNFDLKMLQTIASNYVLTSALPRLRILADYPWVTLSLALLGAISSAQLVIKITRILFQIFLVPGKSVRRFLQTEALARLILLLFMAV